MVIIRRGQFVKGVVLLSISAPIWFFASTLPATEAYLGMVPFIHNLYSWYIFIESATGSVWFEIFPFLIAAGLTFDGIRNITRSMKMGVIRKTGIKPISATQRMKTKEGIQPFRAAKELFRDRTADELCDHLLTLGIQTQIVQGHPLQKICTWKRWGAGAESLGLVQVGGKNIGYINVIKKTDSNSTSDSTDYYLEYLFKLRVIPSSLCRAWLNTEKRGLFRREVVNIEWLGGTLADTLNGDLTLKQSLLTEFQQDRPLDIEVVPEPFYQCARVEFDWHLLSRNMFDCLDRIAGITAAHVDEVNRSPETVLFEAKIEFNPGSKDSEVANCCVTDRSLRIESREPVQIPWYMIEDCSSTMMDRPLAFSMSTANLPEVTNCTVVIRYLDKSRRRRKLEFEMPHREAVPLENKLGSYPKDINR